MIDTEALRKKILDLAIRGKLTEQLPSDGSAEELYAKIQEEKLKLIKEGKIKKEKPLPEITDDEIPFDIPESWKWVHLNNIATSSLGKTLNKNTDVGEEVPYLCSINVYWEGINLDILKTAKFDLQEKTKYRLKKGDLLICEGGETGRSAIWDSDEEMYYQNALHRVRFFGNISAQYMCFVFELYKKNGTIENYTKGIGIKHLVQSSLNSIWLPLPPLAEQRRIGSNIDAIFSQIDIIDDLQSKYINDSAALKIKILDAAIQGKLVEQRAEEGTAEELYKQIQAEKQKLIMEGKIKKEKPLPKITEKEIPFDIPESWKWIKLGNLFSIERGSSPRPIKDYLTKEKDGVNWIKIGDSEVGAKYISSTSEKITPKGAERSRKVEIGDFIISNSMSFGRPYIMAIEGYVHDGWNIIHFISDKNGGELLFKDYVYYILSSDLLKQQMTSKAAGGVVLNIRSDNLKELIVPIPPLAEQRRIVAKIEELLPLCERLAECREKA